VPAENHAVVGRAWRTRSHHYTRLHTPHRGVSATRARHLLDYFFASALPRTENAHFEHCTTRRTARTHTTHAFCAHATPHTFTPLHTAHRTTAHRAALRVRRVRYLLDLRNVCSRSLVLTPRYARFSRYTPATFYLQTRFTAATRRVATAARARRVFTTSAWLVHACSAVTPG